MCYNNVFKGIGIHIYCYGKLISIISLKVYEFEHNYILQVITQIIHFVKNSKFSHETNGI